MFYKYKVGWYNECKDEDTYDLGIVFARDYGTAADRVTLAYGKVNVFDLYLKEIVTDDETDYCLSKEDIAYAFKED